jgi:hypothetical protein
VLYPLYILVLVDELYDTPCIEHNGVKIEFIPKGRIMVGLRYKQHRPTLIIDAIKDRTLGSGVLFDVWWNDCVASKNAYIWKVVNSGEKEE